MVECQLMLDPETATNDTPRWVAEENGGAFEVYLPSWRVPRPTPSEVSVAIDVAAPNVRLETLDREKVEAHPSLTARPIVAMVQKQADRGEVARYEPVGEAEQSEIYRATIPLALMPAGDVGRLQLTVKWGIGTTGGFE